VDVASRSGDMAERAATTGACQQPPVWRAELPLTLPTGAAVPDGPAAIAGEPPVCDAELPLTPEPPTIAEEPLDMPELVVPDTLPVVPGCSGQFGLTKPEAPVFGPPCARAIELEPTIKAATLNNLNDVFM
jgi:hypothetical protein